MRIALTTPAPPGSRAGNRATALRWAGILRGLGHRIPVITEYTAQRCDALIALHAWRSAKSMADFRRLNPDKPLILALTGTDIYRFMSTKPEITLNSIRLADKLVGLHERVGDALPKSQREKLRIIYQSADAAAIPRQADSSCFDVCVAGHLREEKDPLRAAQAARLLPAQSRVRVLHYGRAHDAQYVQLAETEQAENPRYRWFGEVPHGKLTRIYARCRLMVLSSRMEGGANVISEAVAAGLPVLASDIPGNRGLLGEDYPGYFPVGDTRSLSELLLRAERDENFMRALESACAARANLFTLERETQSWRELLAEVGDA